MDKEKSSFSATNAAIAGGLFEINARFGDAGAEFLKGLRGVDNQTGQVFDRSLSKVAQYKINPENAQNNIKQQAGFAAEVASVSKRNAEAIIRKDPTRYVRSEDIAEYGKNHNTVDIVEQLNGTTQSTSQMKFVGDVQGLLQKIAKGDGQGGKNDLSRYMSVDKLELPTEQVNAAKEICIKQANKLRESADKILAKTDLTESDLKTVELLKKQADNYDKLHDKITDSGLSTEEAIRYRLDPIKETIKDMAGTAHRAGIEGAKFGAAIGGSISLITNLIAVQSGNKEFSEAMLDSATGTLKAAGVGYGTAFAGSTAKSLMQQSTSKVMQAASKTGLPGAIVGMCISTTKSIHSYARGDIDETRLMQEMGGIAVGAVATSLFTVVGQGLIPVPVLGGVIGSMVGGIIVNTFYEGFLQALSDAKLAKENRILVEMRCEAARELSRRYQVAFEELFSTKLAQLQEEKAILQDLFSHKDISGDAFCEGMNRFAAVFGKTLTINNMAELDDAMRSTQPIVI
ncbi:hypothetical protein [Pelistega europaea]|uniref:Uncharacterized protein n=1 Tax=Pelistega europaea TaxID=106147 RepID=A0A7Y4P505_9BURK|nr:hypothetical protein [Pelistega europaea]NOL49258.1 hypothetical protein [Pelistega europaea]